MSSRLKPCPFCGATPTERHTVTAGGYRLIAITCPGCKAWGPLVEIDYETGDERSIAPAVAAWNSRPDTSEEGAGE